MILQYIFSMAIFTHLFACCSVNFIDENEDKEYIRQLTFLN